MPSSVSTATVHVVSKENYISHECVTYNEKLPPLRDSYVRARVELLAITSNTYFYAREGHALHWWDAYPVPAAAGLNEGDWGIVPVWGYACVVESGIRSLPKGSRLFGFWPTARMTVELLLQRSGPPGYWEEVSPGRSSLMTLTNRYIHVAESAGVEEDAITAACSVVWQAGWLLNSYIFASDGRPQVHPLGIDLLWTEEDADLSRAVVVSLSASSKAGLVFTWAMRRRAVTTNGPLAMMEVTSHAEAIRDGPEKGELCSRVVNYSGLQKPESFRWILKHAPSKIVIVDFGAPSEVNARFVRSLHITMPFVQIVIIGVRRQVKIMSETDPRPVQPFRQVGRRIQMNTSGVIDNAVALDGAGKVFGDMEAAWEQCRADGLYSDQRINWCEGVDGIRDAWKRLVMGDVSGTSFVAVQM